MRLSKSFIIPTLITISILALNGCEEKSQTVEWYKENPTEMNKVWSKCQASGNDTTNCRNARDADTQIKRANAPVPDLNDLSLPVNAKKG